MCDASSMKTQFLTKWLKIISISFLNICFNHILSYHFSLGVPLSSLLNNFKEVTVSICWREIICSDYSYGIRSFPNIPSRYFNRQSTNVLFNLLQFGPDNVKGCSAALVCNISQKRRPKDAKMYHTQTKKYSNRQAENYLFGRTDGSKTGVSLFNFKKFGWYSNLREMKVIKSRMSGMPGTTWKRCALMDLKSSKYRFLSGEEWNVRPYATIPKFEVPPCCRERILLGEPVGVRPMRKSEDDIIRWAWISFHRLKRASTGCMRNIVVLTWKRGREETYL